MITYGYTDHQGWPGIASYVTSDADTSRYIPLTTYGKIKGLEKTLSLLGGSGSGPGTKRPDHISVFFVDAKILFIKEFIL